MAAHLRRAVLIFVAAAAVIYVGNQIRSGGAPVGDGLAKAVIGGALASVVLTSYMALRARLRAAILQQSDPTTKSSKTP